MLLKKTQISTQYVTAFHSTVTRERYQKASKLELQQYTAPIEVSLDKEQCPFQTVFC